MKDHIVKKDEKSILPSAPPVPSSIRDDYLGAAAYAAVPEVVEKNKKEIEEREARDFQLLYGKKKE
jgi:hypothetical protein